MTWFTYSTDDGTPRQRIGVIGLGFGMNHAQSATIVPEATLVAACALHEEHRRPIEAMGARYYTNYCQMLDTEKLDGVVVALPNDLHAQATIECLGRGLPVLVKSPLRPRWKRPTGSWSRQRPPACRSWLDITGDSRRSVCGLGRHWSAESWET